MTKTIKLNTQIDLLDQTTNLGEAFASVSLNPNVQWAQIVVTDDKKNLNKQRVPKEEFANLIETGLFAPIKMTESSISRGHKEALGKVIGTITQLVEKEDKVFALSALWKKERPEDVALLKQMYLDGNLPQVSWEISYVEASIEDDETEVLHGTSLDGLTIVTAPAYGGRTPIVSMSSVDSDVKNKEDLEKAMDELEQANAKIKELEEQINALNTSVSELTSELEPLREYKETIENQNAQAAKLEDIKTKFSNAKIEKDGDYFEKNKEFLLNLDEKAFDFMLQEMVAFAKAATASTDSSSIPNFVNTDTGVTDPKKLGKFLRERDITRHQNK